jgi:hypothetical protein
MNPLENREIAAIVLNDYPGNHYASWVMQGLKRIETRSRLFNFTGDILICCGAKSVTSAAGKALCIVHMDKGRPMVDEDAGAACIGNAPGRIAYPLTKLRTLSYNFKFTDYSVKKNYQGIFSVRIPDFVNVEWVDNK